MSTLKSIPEPTCYAVLCQGPVDYDAALDLQLRIERLRKADAVADVLLLLEHTPVITLGRNGDRRNLRAPEEILKTRGIVLHQVDRGGDITFHGPGQLVGYPILRLADHERDVHRYMRNLEETVMRVLDEYGISAGREGGLTGVWTPAGKICAMGVHISRWVTRHGLALNVNTDLSCYDLIVPCGLVGRQVASMRSILGHEVMLAGVAEKLVTHFGRVLERKMIPVTESGLRQALSQAERNPEMAEDLRGMECRPM